MPKHKPQSTLNYTLDGRVALITGGAKRIGSSIAQTLHASGMNVVIHYWSSINQAHDLQARLNDLREDSCRLIQADLSDLSKLKSLIDQTVREMGRLDALINNASVFYSTSIEQADEKDWQTLFDTNLRAPFFLSQAAANHLSKHSGSIINLIDIYADRPLKDYPIYCASKAGLASLTRSFAQDLAPDVRVNAIAPGAILWPENQQNEATPKSLLSRIPLKQLGKPQDIANTVLFLLKDARYMTGQIINIDGGRSVVP